MTTSEQRSYIRFQSQNFSLYWCAVIYLTEHNQLIFCAFSLIYILALLTLIMITCRSAVIDVRHRRTTKYKPGLSAGGRSEHSECLSPLLLFKRKIQWKTKWTMQCVCTCTGMCMDWMRYIFLTSNWNAWCIIELCFISLHSETWHHCFMKLAEL